MAAPRTGTIAGGSLAVGVMVDRIRLAERTTHLEVDGVYGVLTWLWGGRPIELITKQSWNRAKSTYLS